ncbi:ABC transporter G family member 9 [Quillaja saponaria]|uniref:ABC transporter G family member 9 n=1 Tax=Quillaja saponaria TaxID=32244 RepID=A0AAD7PAN8_QUISA|nr:ABC transporter G family member 9 [Quillaja saponaria]
MMLEKERSSGMYRLSSYFMSRMVADLPMGLVLPTIFVCMTYFMAGLRDTAANFLFTLSALLLNVLVSEGLGLAIGAIVMDLKSAATLGHYTYKLLMGSQYSAQDFYPCTTTNVSQFCPVAEYPAIKQVGLDGQPLSVLVMVILLVAYRLVAYVSPRRVGVTK